ncbi:uncharacterized protein N7479_000714 [Penicillium vulpinum]|uniref:Uncharacterized protein n=1 Tax=Penicillium vulpinum TaxID=29845 RepID=A0A1V6S6Y9_9EURO|nr:uncharacterized protein N7479_000714 [Penicillium vulpinum]KAJ5970796.1 hypothetical protein N7479_000714 [Penicillium vulpinum]OQE09636.1 hypothetical protein PENVUL_c006G00937 [Penicillium vulpinum]
MSDAKSRPERENHPEREDHPASDTEENKPINFEWTPELVKIGTSRGKIHPSLGPIEFQWGASCCEYRPGMILPDPADTQECLKWIGLSDKKAIEMEQQFNDLYPDDQAPSCGYDEEFQSHTTHYNEITFPKIKKMLDMFIDGMYDNKEEFEYTHKGYIEHGIKLGLRPEFAIFCGLHKDDPRAIENPKLFQDEWFCLGPADIMSDTLIPFWMNLSAFMRGKLIYEGKAWAGAYGMWLVHEGETMDQAKARVDDREIERLKVQARKKSEENRERRNQEREREYAEDRARWAEEERLEAEMLKQQSIDKPSQQKEGDRKE